MLLKGLRLLIQVLLGVLGGFNAFYKACACVSHKERFIERLESETKI